METKYERKSSTVVFLQRWIWLRSIRAVALRARFNRKCPALVDQWFVWFIDPISITSEANNNLGRYRQRFLMECILTRWMDGGFRSSSRIVFHHHGWDQIRLGVRSMEPISLRMLVFYIVCIGEPNEKSWDHLERGLHTEDFGAVLVQQLPFTDEGSLSKYLDENGRYFGWIWVWSRTWGRNREM